MRVRVNKTVIVILVAGFMFSCAGNTGSLENNAPGLSLRVQEETYVDGGTIGKVSLNTVPTGEGYAVEISVTDALSLKALFFELDYDAKLWHPVGSKSTGVLDVDATPLDVSHLGSPGTVSHGQIVQHYDQHSGFSGNGVLARVEFAAGAAPMLRKTSTLGTPHGSDPIVFVDYYNKFLRVYHNIRGDYDQNGEVNLADIMPLSLFFGERSDGQGSNTIGSFTDGELVDRDDTNPRVYADGNLDGEINLADLSTIAMQFGNSFSSIKVFATDDYSGFYPFGGGMADDAVVVDTFNLPLPTGNSRTMRVYRDIELPQIDPLKHYWVRPGSETEYGLASMVGFDLGDYPPLIDREFGLEYEAGSQILSFNMNFRGDYDLNGEVNLADLTPLAYYFSSPSPFTADKIEWNIDGTRDGNLSFADFYPVERFFLMECYIEVYSTLNPTHIPEDNISPELLQPVRQMWSGGSRSGVGLNNWWEGLYDSRLIDRPRYRTVIAFEPGAYVWIRLVSGGGDESPRSEVIQIP